MEFWLWILCAALLILVLLLCIRICQIKKSVNEIRQAFSDRLRTDTNTLIAVSCNDNSIRLLAAAINSQLRLLREERHRFCQGDMELKEAVTNISHDLRTPLTAILGYLSLLEQEDANDNVKRYLAVIADRTDHLCALTEELFRYSIIASSQEDKRPVTLELNAVLEECIAACYGTLKEKGIEPHIILPSQAILRRLDRNALVRIIGNIMSNAMKYSEGNLTITMDLSGTIIVSNETKKIDAVLVEKLFDRFFTVETGYNSTGLGLSIAKILTEQMHGTIHAEYCNNIFSIILSFPEDNNGACIS